jgi:hypothetical protein
MKVRFHGQPFDNFGGWTANWLTQVLRNPTVDHLRVAVAWMKRSGLLRVADELKAFKARGGSASVIVGIDEGGATAQGLQLALDLFDSVYVFHEKGSRTFHPKAYLGYGSSTAEVLIGSNNVTAGGLFSNYEASLLCCLDLQMQDDRGLFDLVNSWFDTMLSDAPVCKTLTPELLETLISNPHYKIGDEDRAKRDKAEEDDYDGVGAGLPEDEIFGTSLSPKAGMAPAAVAPSREPVVAEVSTAPPVPAPAVVTHRWWKQMSRSDAQQPLNPNSSPTGHLKLAKAGHDIDHKTYFRNHFFGNATWAVQHKKRGPKEEAIIQFNVTIDGLDRGQIALKVDHAEYRIANQDNIPTWLHWGPLGTVLRLTDYKAAWVILERLQSDKYRLEVTWTAPSGTG